MAVTDQKSTQRTNEDASPQVMNPTHNALGRMRISYFSHTQSGAGDVLSTVELVKLPAGNVRLLGLLCAIRHNWTEATVDMDVGWNAYTGHDGVAVVADDDGLDADVDVESAGIITIGSVLAANANQKVFQSKGGVTIVLKAQAAGLGDGDTVEGYLVWIRD